MIDYDLIVIGAGSGGYVTAIRAAQLGASVAVIEKGQVGGTCLNRGCIPTKTMVASARLAEELSRAGEYGIEMSNNYKVNFDKIVQRKNTVVDELVQGINYLLKKNGIELIRGKASLLSSNLVEVKVCDDEGNVDSGAKNKGDNVKKLKAKSIVIASGSKPFILPEFNYDGINVVSSKEVLDFSALPGKMVIIGAGYIGCEFASIFSALGCEVTIVELMKQILPGEDRSTAKRMERIFTEKGIQILTDTKVDLVELRNTDKQNTLKKDDGVVLKEDNKLLSDINNVIVHLSNGETIKTEKVLVAIGRTPVTKELGLEELGVEIDERGAIVVNDKLETNIPGIYAVGDVTRKVMLAHVASAQGIVVAENIMGNDKVMDYLSIPSAIFTNPELARTGLSFSEARKQGYKVEKGRFPYRANGKAKAMGEDTGMVTLICEKESGKILGGEVFGADAANLISEITLAVNNEITAENLASTIHAHPTLAETIMEAAEDVFGKSIHS